MTHTDLIGLDWGATQLRAYRFVDGGEVAETRQLPAGVLRIATDDSVTQRTAPGAGFERAFEDACGDWWRAWPKTVILACGMVGSAQGWREAAYLDAPVSVDGLGRSLTEIQTHRGAVLHIIPGVIARGPLPEVMRGEETQVAGAIEGGADAAGPRAGAWIGLPGTHSKWVRVQDGRIVQFRTFMTGEVFAALCEHTILGRTMRRLSSPDFEAFDRGVELARSPHARAGLLSTIFSTRTLGLVGALPAESQADYLSGLLVGSEIAALEALGALGEHLAPIMLVGSDELCQRYRRALAAFGHAAAIAAHATERGLWRVAVSAGLVARSRAC